MNVNPFRELRLHSGGKAGLSQYELARRIGISKHAILRLEQGMYEDPLPTVVTYWIANGHREKRHLLSEYAEFQIATRESNARLFGDLVLSANPLNEHPLTYLRNHADPPLNTTQVAKKLCLSQSILFYFERNPIVQGIVPEQFIRALHDADYTSDETQSLENAYAIFRQHRLKQQNIKVTPAIKLSPRDELASPITETSNVSELPPVGLETGDAS